MAEIKPFVSAIPVQSVPANRRHWLMAFQFYNTWLMIFGTGKQFSSVSRWFIGVDRRYTSVGRRFTSVGGRFTGVGRQFTGVVNTIYYHNYCDVLVTDNFQLSALSRELNPCH